LSFDGLKERMHLKFDEPDTDELRIVAYEDQRNTKANSFNKER